jgi:AraC family transcriptional regulator
MSEFSSHLLLETATAAVWDVACRGACRHKSAEECAAATHLVFPYRGVYVHHAERGDAVAEANQVVFINGGEGYRVSHPVAGGDASLSVGIDAATLDELAPGALFDRPGLFNRTRLRIDPRAQALVALLRHSLTRATIETAVGGERALAGDCGGRTPNYDAANVYRSMLAGGKSTGISDGLVRDEQEHSTSVFPFLAPPP